MGPARVARFACVFAVACVAAKAADRFPLVWPTPNPAWASGKSPSSWLQHAGSGDPESGGFGGVRGGGSQFHEGIDIRPVARDRNGEPRDSVFAAMPGVVRHVSLAPGESSYGRYVVIEHPTLTPAIYTLYAHLARIAPEVRPGRTVAAGDTIGTMGHSSGGYMIPAERSHLHFEIGLAMTQNFQSWYDARRFGSRNEHGMWNGMNLIGIDPVAFFNAWRAGRIASPQDFFNGMETAVRVRIATYRKPDFISRYPSLLTKELPVAPVAGWEIRFNWTGLPFAWTPLTGMEVAGLPPGEPRFLEVNTAVTRRERSKHLAVQRRGTWTAGKDLEIVLGQLFGK
jgi:murein DD-endopeptidase MepM/ murein hydrolase activator NlpD